MTWQSVLEALVVGITVLVLAGRGSSSTMRYKMVVEVDTPEGLRSGAAVREIRFTKPSNFPSIGESRPQWRANGEAVAVDLPDGRTLFALLKSGDGDVNYAGRDVWFLFCELGEAAPDGVIELWPAMPKTKLPRIANPLPLLVTFRDTSDPKTVEQVDPANLADCLGPGVRLKRITIERTRQPVTRGIDRRIEWLEKYRARHFDGTSTVSEDMIDDNPAAHLWSRFFSTEFKK